MISLAELLTRKDGSSAFAMGNHALARAMAEAGTAVITSCPGSPTPEIAAGASPNGHSSAVFFKSVGLNVAADSLIQLPLMQLTGGMVVILGDDPAEFHPQSACRRQAPRRLLLRPAGRGHRGSPGGDGPARPAAGEPAHIQGRALSARFMERES